MSPFSWSSFLFPVRLPFSAPAVSSKPEHRIIIGIDFGTTYSGIAWANTLSPKEITPIRQWPGAVGGLDADKVPSEMKYLDDGTLKWGFLATAENFHQDRKLLRYMKLLLDPTSEELSSVDPLGLKIIQAALPPYKKPVDAVSDYLKAIKDHALQVLSKDFGTEFWKVIPIEYHLTIPAVWSEAAKALTLRAANNAGIGSKDDIVLITEPEAAALYCLTDRFPGKLKVGDTFVLADCGGGTVDLVSYEILQVAPRFEVKEVGVGGGLCGSVFLNLRFEAFVRRRLGTKIVDEMVAKGRPYQKMMKDFDERLKRIFQDSNDQDGMDCEVPGVPDDYRRKVQDGFLDISRADMQSIFEPVIEEILRLIQEQLDTIIKGKHKPASTIVLIGGFGSSSYLYKRVKKHLETHSQDAGNIEVVLPTNAWSAVARGAVICGLENIRINSRRARRNYGVAADPIYDAEIHPYESRFWCPLEGKYKASCIVTWYVKQGDEIGATKELSIGFYRMFQPYDTDFTATIVLLASNSPRTQVEQRSTHPNVYEVCSIRCDLQKLRRHFKTRKSPKGEVYYVINYNLVMHIHSAQLTFSLKCNGVQHGDATTVRFF
ncbi:hypothetical protein BDZ91DRAFT_718518 [Kalaharituber pfeilii]|nr:hypothetical protein BDZ91DRAFT_718518 [Kalaharituber pfeilii]